MKADRDASMDQLLASTLKSRATAAKGDSCLDVETLAAWADGALDARERAAAEQHAADCARCQALLAAMVKTLPPEIAKSPWRMPSLTLAGSSHGSRDRARDLGCGAETRLPCRCRVARRPSSIRQRRLFRPSRVRRHQLLTLRPHGCRRPSRRSL